MGNESGKEDAKRMEIFLEDELYVAQHNARCHKGEETSHGELNKFSDWLPEEMDMLNGLNKERRLLAKDGEVPFPKLNAEIFIAPAKPRSQENQGCNGGFVHFSFEYVRKNNGLNQKQLPLREQASFKCNNVRATCNGYVQLKQNEKRLREAVATVGPIVTNLHIRHKSFQLYESGIYSKPKCHPHFLVRAVLLVGYGIDPGTQQEYWLVKTLGTQVGEIGDALKSQGTLTIYVKLLRRLFIPKFNLGPLHEVQNHLQKRKQKFRMGL